MIAKLIKEDISKFLIGKKQNEIIVNFFNSDESYYGFVRLINKLLSKLNDNNISIINNEQLIKDQIINIFNDALQNEIDNFKFEQ